MYIHTYMINTSHRSLFWITVAPKINVFFFSSSQATLVTHQVNFHLFDLLHDSMLQKLVWGRGAPRCGHLYRRLSSSVPQSTRFARAKSLQQSQEELASNSKWPAEGGEIHGWVQSMRKSKNVKFVDIVDGSRWGVTQAVVPTGQDASPGMANLVEKYVGALFCRSMPLKRRLEDLTW